MRKIVTYPAYYKESVQDMDNSVIQCYYWLLNYYLYEYRKRIIGRA